MTMYRDNVKVSSCTVNRNNHVLKTTYMQKKGRGREYLRHLLRSFPAGTGSCFNLVVWSKDRKVDNVILTSYRRGLQTMLKRQSITVVNFQVAPNLFL